MRLGFLGTGTIAGAVVRGIADQGHEIAVSQRNHDMSAALARSFPNVTVMDNQAVIDASDVIFLGSTADAAALMLAPLTFRSSQQVVSFMLGISPAEVAAMVEPATFNTMMIPFPSIEQGGSPVLIHPGSELIMALFGELNTVITLASQAAFNEFLSAQAVLSPVAKMLATTVDWLGEKTGDPHAAEQFLRQLVGGSIMAAPMSAQNVLTALLASLDTPGGLNAQLRDYMAEQNTYADLKNGLDALSRRMSEG